MKPQNTDNVIIEGQSVVRRSTNVDRGTINLQGKVGDVLRKTLGIEAIDTSKEGESFTTTFDPYDWVSDSGTLVAKETEAKVTLILIPIVNHPGWRLYSTYLSRITTQGYRTRPYRGGRHPRAGGWMNLDMNFLTASGGYLDGWDYKFYMQCDWNNRELSDTSHNYSSNFFSLTKEVTCSTSFSALVRC